MLPPPLWPGWFSLPASAAPPPVVVELDCAGLSTSRHSLLLTGLAGDEVGSAVVPLAPEGRTTVVLNPSAIPVRAALVGASCNLSAEVDGDLIEPFRVRLSDRPLEAPAAPSADPALVLTTAQGRTPAALGRLVMQALAGPPGNPTEALLAGVPRLEGHPADPRLAVELDGRPATVVVGRACPCPAVPPGARATATRVGDVVVVSAHDGPSQVVVLPGPAATVAQVLCGCAAAPPLWADGSRRSR